jgi:hypothetical protein
VVGFEDEVWWSRLKQPAMRTWSGEKEALRLVELSVSKQDPDPKALCCYGLLRDDTHKVMLRFVDGRPVSSVTITYLEWVCERLRAEGKKVFVMIWDNASWHVSREVMSWIRTHNQKVLADRRGGKGGVQLIPCFLPSKSPWLNPIEPKWVHGKRAIVEPTRTLAAHEVAGRVCNYFDCEHVGHIEQKIA